MSTMGKPGAIAPFAELAVREPVSRIAVAPPSFAMPRTLADLKTLAEIMYQSGMFKDLRSSAQALVKISAGAALGYDPVTSMSAFHIIEGRIAPTAGEITARIKRSGRYRLKSWFIDAKGEHVDPTKPGIEPNGCVVQVHEQWGRKWETLEPVVFTKQDAIAAGLIGKGVWKQYFRNMAYARALTNAARWHCADVFGGPVYTPEELGANVAIDAEGEMVVLDAGDAAAIAPVVEPKVRPMSGAEAKELYAKARAKNPDLPEDIREWAASFVKDYAPPNNPTGRQMLEIQARLLELTADEVVQGELVLDGETVVTDGEIPTVDDGAPKMTDAPKMTGATKRQLFAVLGELEMKVKPARIAWAKDNGVEVASFAELSEPQAVVLVGKALAQRDAQRSGA